ncbi:FecR family protein [Pedobacter sp. HDW13]|uniref:FecR family protein n=1 Tax=unclassified Pedobacter TaxID=2628915 RepID=UPI000F594D05|nr:MULTISPECIES: FecR family protein [unclassified Pedobacter]QIL41217.1 FecR family protein [Pedobacter sp. HDW13]RQO77066.1 anti-sigma factor [Pedobacter sp. KBW01]
MEHKRAEALLEKYLAGHCTPEEVAIVESWYLQVTENPEALAPEPDYASLGDSMWGTIQERNNPPKKVKLQWGWAAAAVILLALGFGLYQYKNTSQPEMQSVGYLVKNDIKPGGNKAFLTLANGAKISLDDTQNGKIAEQQGVSITKTAKGELVYTAKNATAQWLAGKQQFNTIETPKGGQYQINLPDGTKVWLNAASSLKYPTSFASTGREVQLKGEAYFEVAKKTTQGQRVPFTVKTETQVVEVLGTHFNINSYNNEENTKTTLVEGSVRVTPVTGSGNLAVLAKVLKPGEQSLLKGSSVKITAVETEEALAWKEGLFMFDNENLESIMHKVARWYDVEVVFKDKVLLTKDYSGTVSRFGNVSQVLKKLELTGSVHFNIEGRRIVVMK